MRPTNSPCVPCGSDIAIALHTPPHRAISLALLAQALGATQGKGILRRNIAALAEASRFAGGGVSALAEASTSFVKGRIGARKSTKVLTGVLNAAEMPSVQDDV